VRRTRQRILVAALAALVLTGPARLHVVATVKTPTQPISVSPSGPARPAASFDFGGVLRIDPRTNTVSARVKTGRGPIGVAYGAGSVWVANWLENTVSRVDPASERC
jgi:DNA-binding beta-propeller fold protein YncE